MNASNALAENAKNANGTERVCMRRTQILCVPTQTARLKSAHDPSLLLGVLKVPLGTKEFGQLQG